MATRRTGSRPIVVDGVAYRWRIRRRATQCQADYGRGKLHVAVELAERPGAVLVLVTDRPHPRDWSTEVAVPVTPSDVAEWVRLAIRRGWIASEGGPQFHLDISRSPVGRIGLRPRAEPGR
jgi:hypothetical protein